MAGNLGRIMQQAQKMQRDLAQLDAELKERMVEGTAGDGAVTAIASGDGRVVSVRITPDVADPGDVETLEDLVIIAVNAALDKARDLQKSERDKVTGGLNLPGML